MSKRHFTFEHQGADEYTEPTLSQDVLEAVPAWGAELWKEILDMREAHAKVIDEQADLMLELQERFEKLRSIVERQLVANQRDRERVAKLEATAHEPAQCGKYEAEPEPYPREDD